MADRVKAQSRYRQNGLSLIEMMVALAIGVLLLAGVIQIFISNKQTYRFQQALSRVEESGRYAIGKIRSDLRMAGYQGCGGSSMLDEVVDYRKNPRQNFKNQIINGLRGFEADSSGKIKQSKPPLLKSAPVTPDGDSEGLLISSMQPTDVTFQDDDPPSIKVQKSSSPDPRDEFDKCDVVYMEDRSCGWGRSFIAGSSSSAANMNLKGTGSCSTKNKKAATGGGTLAPKPWPADTSGARALQVRRFLYHIQTNANGQPTLHRWTSRGNGSGNNIELAEGVEEIHVEYGEDTGGEEGAINGYFELGSVTNWDDVLAARVSIVVRSREDNVVDEQQTVSFPPGATYDATDKRLRQVFTTTVAFRNRLP